MPRKDFLEFSFSDIDFRLLAVHTSLSAPAFAWNCDRLTGTSFNLRDSGFRTVIKKKDSEHLFFHAAGGEESADWALIENQGSGGVLVNTRPAPDLLLISFAEDADDEITDLVEKLRNIPGVSLVFEMTGDEKEKMPWSSELISQL